MNLIYDDTKKSFMVKTKIGTVTLREVLEIYAKRDGRALSRIDLDAGMSGNLRSPAVGLQSYLRAFIELGFDINLEKKQ